MNRKALALLSGGLDSTLAIKCILEQGIEVKALNFITPFFSSKIGYKIDEICSEFGIELKVVALVEEYFEIIKHPKYGYGSNMNPCIDCKILMFKKAKEYMEEIGASFIITGEVLGQRPMSQRKNTMKTIDKEAGLEWLVLRPLSAKLLDPTISEIEGVVDREKLLAFCGRSRKPQFALAKDYNLKNYSWPAGGCLLTDPEFAKRMRDLVKHTPFFTINDVELLKIGRHFRLSEGAKVIVGRDKIENERLLELRKNGDLFLETRDYLGPIVLFRGKDKNVLEQAGKITARYSDAPPLKEHIVVSLWEEGSNKKEGLIVVKTDKKEIESYRI
ncbi:TPA: hypothetical protein DCX16_07030 [bacterium]|nr:hypothetical protein [bacterium]